MATTALPPSLTQAVAAEHVAELRAEAARRRLARAARGRAGHRWPANVARALRDSLAETLPTRSGRSGTAACPTC